MSEKVLCEKSDLVAIADAVREATGSTENYNVSELSAATIEAISVGGSGTLYTGTLVGVSTMADEGDDGGYVYRYNLEDIPNISSKKLVVLCSGELYTAVLSRMNTTDTFSIKRQWTDYSSNIFLNDNRLQTVSPDSRVFTSFDYYAV